MNRRKVIALATGVMLLAGTVSFAEEQKDKPPMHMHKSEMDHGRTAPKGTANYENVAKHCDQLAKYCENAAKEAEGISAELSK
jgi:hypothetical protein